MLQTYPQREPRPGQLVQTLIVALYSIHVHSFFISLCSLCSLYMHSLIVSLYSIHVCLSVTSLQLV